MAIGPSTTGRRQRAQAMVEFAMVVLVTLTLIFGIIQASLALYAYGFISYAARTGARYAMVRGSHSSSPATNSSVQSYIQGLAIGINASSLTVTTSWNPNNNPGGTVTVSVSYVFAPLAPLVWRSSLTMASTAQALITN